MKYYAVTEDPNELFHYGRLGMKWGQHIFGDKPKSPGYKRALGKLRASTKSAKSAIKKSATQRAINKTKKQQNKYNQAVKKAQRNNELIGKLHKLDQVRVNERGLDRDYWGAAKIARIQDRQNRKLDKINSKRMIREAKAEVKYNKKELKMDKYMQKAREGKLKYGQLSDDQVQRLTNRLNMERNARQLGSAEKSWRQQKKEAFRQGKLQGITRGTAASMEEVARAATIYGIQNYMNRKKLNAKAKQEGKEERIKSRAKNKKSKRDMREDFKAEVYEERVRDGQIRRTKKAAENLRNIEMKRLEDDRKRKLQARINDEMDLAANDAYQKMLENKREREFQFAERERSIQSARQRRENIERADEDLKNRAKIAYEYGFLTSGGGKGNNNGGKGGSGGDRDEIKRLSSYYDQRYIKGETIQQEYDRVKKSADEAIRLRDEATKAEAAAAVKQAKRDAKAEKRKQNFNKAFDSVQRGAGNLRSTMYDKIDNMDSKVRGRDYQKEQQAELERNAEAARKVTNAQKNTSTKRKQNKKRRSEMDSSVVEKELGPMWDGRRR